MPAAILRSLPGISPTVGLIWQSARRSVGWSDIAQIMSRPAVGRPVAGRPLAGSRAPIDPVLRLGLRGELFDTPNRARPLRRERGTHLPEAFRVGLGRIGR